MAISTNGTIITRLAGALYGEYLSNANYAEVSSTAPATVATNFLSNDFASKTDKQLATTILTNLGLTSITGLDNWLAAQFTAAGSSSAAKGAKLVSILNDYAGMSADPTYGTYATSFNAKTTASLTLSQTAGNLGGSFADADSVSISGQTFTLTTGTNKFTGTIADDTFDAGLSSSSLQTLTSGDILDGGAGTDEVFAVINGSVTPTLSNIENIYVTNVSTTAAATLDLTSSTGMSSVVNRSATFSTVISGVSNTVPVTVRDTSLANQYVTYNNVTGTADSATISINNLTSNATLEVAGVETLTLASSGSTANVLAAYNATATNSTTTLNVTGVTGLTVTAALPTAVTKVDGSAITGTGSTGALKVIMGSTGVATVAGGAGNDSLSAVNTTGAVSINAGSGNDTILGGAYVTTTDTIDGGDGTADVLTMTAASAANFTAAPTTYLITNVETIGMTDEATAATIWYPAYISATATRMNFANANTTAGTDVTAGAATVVGGTSGDLIVGLGGSLASNQSHIDGALTLTTTGTGTFDTVTLTNSAIELTAGTNINVYDTENIVTSGYEKLVVGTGSTSSGVAMTTGTITVAGTTGSTSAETVAFTGTHTITTGVITADIVDASAMTYTGTTATLTMVTASTATTVTGSAGYDILYGATGTASSITAGAGNDSIYGGTANDTLLGEAGNDSITAGSGNDSINGGAGNDTINMAGNIATGDVINGGDGTDTLLSSIAITAAGALNISNVEVIGFTAGITQDMVNFLNAGVTTLATTLGSLDVDNAQTTLTTMVFGATAAMGTPSVDRLSDGSSDAMSLLMTDGTTPTFTSVDMADEETLTIGEYGTDSSAAVTIALNTVTATDLKTLTITGSNNHTMTLSGETLLATVDASAATGTLNIAGGNSAANMTVTGTPSTAMSIVGGSGNDSVTAGAGADSITGGNGNDTIIGNGGNDTIIGGLGVDSLVGGDGTDTISAAYTLSTDGGSIVATGVVINLSSSAVLATTIDNYVTTGAVLLGVNSDISSVAAGTMVNLQTATNVATVSSRVDTLSGFEAIQGSAGTDYLIGSSSANTITGGAQADVMVGGSGADTFSRSADDSIVASGVTFAGAIAAVGDTITFGDGVDVITDFTSGTDFIDIAGTDNDAILTLIGFTVANNLVANTQYYASGAYTKASGAFVIAANGGGADTLIIDNIAAGTIAVSTNVTILIGVVSSTLVTNIIADLI